MKKNLDTAVEDVVFFPSRKDTPPKDSYTEKIGYQIPEKIKEEHPYFYEYWDGFN